MLGIHMMESPECRVVKTWFNSEKTLEYNYEHQNMEICAMMAEDMNLAMSGGRNEQFVLYNLTTGDVLGVFQLGIGRIYGLLRMGNVVFVGGRSKEVKVFDLVSQEEISTEKITTQCYIYCMSIGNQLPSGSSEKQLTLLVGGWGTPNVTSVKLPENVSEKSKSSGSNANKK